MEITTDKMLQDLSNHYKLNKEESIIYFQLFETVTFFRIDGVNQCLSKLKELLNIGYHWKSLALDKATIRSFHLKIVFSNLSYAETIHTSLSEWILELKKKPCSCGKIHESDESSAESSDSSTGSETESETEESTEESTSETE